MAATFVGEAMSGFIQYGLDHFPSYNALKHAFLVSFWKEKTPGAILKKLQELKEKHLLVEDYVQEFQNLTRGYQRLRDLLGINWEIISIKG